MEPQASVARSHGPAMLLRPRGQDSQVLIRGNRLFQGYHVRAALPGGITSVVRESGKPWLVDPETYVFAQPHRRLLDFRKEPPVVRSSAAALACAYGAPFSNVVGQRSLSPEDFEEEGFAREAVERVLNYQRAKFAGQLGLLNPYYEKYRIWDDDEGEVRAPPSPRVLVPPYFYFKSLDDPWLAVNVNLARYALAARKHAELVYPIVLFSPRLLSAQGVVAGIVRRYLSEKFDGYLLWPNDFKEDEQPPERLKGLARLVQDLADSGQRVSKLYGGFFTALLGRTGLRGFSCGLGYGTSKNAFAYGGGKLPQRYYIPRLHRAFEFGEALGIIEANPDLRCGCRVCAEVFGRKLEHFDQMRENGRCEYHFLTVRDAELHRVAQATAAEIARELREGAQGFPGSSANGQYLESWADVLC